MPAGFHLEGELRQAGGEVHCAEGYVAGQHPSPTPPTDAPQEKDPLISPPLTRHPGSITVPPLWTVRRPPRANHRTARQD